MKPKNATINPEGGMNVDFLPDEPGDSFILLYNGREIGLPSVRRHIPDSALAMRIIVEARPEDIGQLFEAATDAPELKTYRPIGRAMLIDGLNIYPIGENRTFREGIIQEVLVSS